MYCIKCGKELIPNKRFCIYCGTEVISNEVKEERTIKVRKPFCQYCGTELEPEDKFCLNCGKEVPQKEETEKDISVEIETAVEEAETMEIPQVVETIMAEISAPIEEHAVEEITSDEKESATVLADTTNVAEEPVDETPTIEAESITEKESVVTEETAEDTMEERQEEVPDDTNEVTEESIKEASMFAIAAEADTVIPTAEETVIFETEKVFSKKGEETSQANEVAVTEEMLTETAPEKDAEVREEVNGEESKEVPTKKKKRWLVWVVVLVVIAALAAAGILYYQWSKVCQNTYQEALTLLEEEHYNESLVAFTSLGSYKDAQDQCAAITAILDAKYEAASDLLESEEYKEALAIFESLKDYKDSEEQCKSIRALIEEKAKLEEGITLLLSDGTIIRPEDPAYQVANCDGAVVRFNGEVVTDYQCDVDGKGTSYPNTGRCWCDTDAEGKLYFWLQDMNHHTLHIAYQDEIATFQLNTDEIPFDTIHLGVPWQSNMADFTGFGYGGREILTPFKVYYNGEETSDYTIQVSNTLYGTAEKNDDGTFKITQRKNGEAFLTIICHGLSRTYRWYCYDPNNSQDTPDITYSAPAIPTSKLPCTEQHSAAVAKTPPTPTESNTTVTVATEAQPKSVTLQVGENRNNFLGATTTSATYYIDNGYLIVDIYYAVEDDFLGQTYRYECFSPPNGAQFSQFAIISNVSDHVTCSLSAQSVLAANAMTIALSMTNQDDYTVQFWYVTNFNTIKADLRAVQ